MATILAWHVVGRLHGEGRLLDDFESLSGWLPVTSEGAHLTLAQDTGYVGKAMLMDFSFAGGYGYVIARKEFHLDLPDDYQFVFHLRGETPVNNFEFKLLDSLGNVYWVKKLNVEYPTTWKRTRVKRRDITFAWGPSGPSELRRTKYVEFVVSTGSGGRGKVWIDNFWLEALHVPGLAAEPSLRVSAARGVSPVLSPTADTVRTWRVRPSRSSPWLAIDFGRVREIGGLVLDWEPQAEASHYAVEVSSDGETWEEVYRVTDGNGGRDYIPTPDAEGRHIRLRLLRMAGKKCVLRQMVVKGPDFASSANSFFRCLAKEEPPGAFPAYFYDRQTYWTVVGVSGDQEEALINEHGMIEIAARSFSLEPFLWVDGRLISWHDVSATQSLVQDYLPIPSVTWHCEDVVLSVTAVAAGEAGASTLFLRYRVRNRGRRRLQGALFVAIRPFQVSPPWQILTTVGGVGRMDSVSYRPGVIWVDGRTVVSLTPPSDFGASVFDRGDISEYLLRGVVPERKQVLDLRHLASAAIRYNLDITPGDSVDFVLLVPSPGAGPRWEGMVRHASPGAIFAKELEGAIEDWTRELNRVSFDVPAEARPLVNTLRSNLAYILINRDGPSLKPGSRTYDRSWIRDGSLTSTALLQMGFVSEPRQFIDWYASFQYPTGKVPCVVDHRGPDPLPEHDSHGELIYAIAEYFRFTHDTTWLRQKWPHALSAARYIQTLRRERKVEEYRLGPPEKRVLYGLLPESISHEGYSAKPMHSYWDNFFALRGLKDAAFLAHVLGETGQEAEVAREVEELRNDLYNSMRLAMSIARVDYIPGCAELGDFDPTSTTIGVCPGGELGWIPEPELHNTFERYYRFALDRRDGHRQWENYTPYELRSVGTFVYLNQRDRAHELLDFFMKDRRPPGWNHWAEVVWRHPLAPKYVGDMPHTWVGSDFIRSVRAMFAYEDEAGNLVVAGGLPAAWLEAPGGVKVSNLPTHFGFLSYAAEKKGNIVRARIDLTPTGPATVLFKPPMEGFVRTVRVNGKPWQDYGPEGVHLTNFPALVEIEY
ncbi:MAG: discoidin domain-containing protein [candidate division KSB1 bacterium]|nr:discoidin domain-containing protein [candidate division KSB1 bacterium]